MKHKSACLTLCSLLVLAACAAPAPKQITAPKEQFGHNIGDDYQLVSYAKMIDYWKKLDQESDRISLVEIGKTAEGRTMYTAIITSPANHQKLDRYKEISRRLSLAEGLTESEARALATEGKAVVWIDSGLHIEPVGTQMLIEFVYLMASRNDAEVQRILDNVVVLVTNINPDGLEMYADWYLREPEPTKRRTDWLPRLYNKYIGHDDNRDFYMVNMPESEAVNRMLYYEWFPQIMWDQHQAPVPGGIFFGAPFRSPFNYELDPLCVMGIDLVGAALHSRIVSEGKPGDTMRSESNYQTWWNGGGRTAPYFHNQIGFLTEFIGNPTPEDPGNAVRFLPDKLLPYNDNPNPIPPQRWRLRQSIDYSLTIAWGVLDLASKLKENFLFNIYLMGKNSIDKGSRDNWTMHPKRLAEVKAAMERDKAKPAVTGREGGGYPEEYYKKVLQDPAARDARGYIIPADQDDFLTATKFVNVLIKGGVTVHRATQSFPVAGKSYPAGSYVVKAAQAYRPHLRTMFEPQDYPDDVEYPGGPPKAPYDITGWTLAFQMGVKFDPVFDGFDGPFEKLADLVTPPAGKVTGTGAAGYVLSHQVNDAVVAVNQLLAGGEKVYWLKNPVQAGGKTYSAGTIYIPAQASTAAKLQTLAAERGLNFDAIEAKPTGDALSLKRVRIGLWDQYGGSMPSGWIRWLFEQYGFSFEVVYPPALDAGNLSQKYDVLVFPDGAISMDDARLPALPDPKIIPEEYRARIGALTVSKTVPQLRQFLEAGGTILAIGSSTSLAYLCKVPVADALIDKATRRPLAEDKYYVPGSVLGVRVDTANPLAYGMPEKADVFFDNSPVFQIGAGPAAKGVRRVAWFDSDKPLRSGWSMGQQYLNGGTVVVDADVGKGKLILYGPEITFRGQPHGTFKLLFNGIYYGSATPERLQD